MVQVPAESQSFNNSLPYLFSEGRNKSMSQDGRRTTEEIAKAIVASFGYEEEWCLWGPIKEAIDTERKRAEEAESDSRQVSQTSAKTIGELHNKITELEALVVEKNKLVGDRGFTGIKVVNCKDYIRNANHLDKVLSLIPKDIQPIWHLPEHKHTQYSTSPACLDCLADIRSQLEEMQKEIESLKQDIMGKTLAPTCILINRKDWDILQSQLSAQKEEIENLKHNHPGTCPGDHQIATQKETIRKMREAAGLLVDHVSHLMELLKKEPSMQNKAKWDDVAGAINYHLNRTRQALTHHEGIK